MRAQVLILLLTAIVTTVQSHPIGIIFETGVKSNATVKAEGHAGAATGWSWGPTLEGKAEGGIYGKWLKNAYAKIGYIDSKGVPHGFVASIGSNMDGRGVANASAKARTNLINTNVDKNAKVDGDASYQAGLDIHYLDKNDITGVEGVNKQPVKTSEETVTETNQSTDGLNQGNRDSKQVGEKKQGIIKRFWNKIVGK